LPAGWRID